MIVRKIGELTGSDREVHAENWTSKRLLLHKDGMGFSLHDTTIHPGTSTRIWYQNHLEAVYCVEGKGSVTDLRTQEVHPIESGTMYALDENDEHILTAETRMRMICVFNPALVGPEVHDENGVYPTLQP